MLTRLLELNAQHAAEEARAGKAATASNGRRFRQRAGPSAADPASRAAGAASLWETPMTERSGVTPVVRRFQPRPSKLYPVFWRFAAERQRIYLRRVAVSPPVDEGPSPAAYRFTNPFRASDRVSQYLIRLAHADRLASYHTCCCGPCCSRIFNRIDTWEHIVQHLGPPVAFRFDYATCDELLGARIRAGTPIYSAAYIMPSGGRRGVPKHSMHCD